MLSKTLGVMFKVKQLFTKIYVFLLHIMLFLIHFNSFEVICCQSLKVSKTVVSLRVMTPGPEFCDVTLHNVYYAAQRLYLKDSSTTYIAVDSGCYLASSITSHFKILKLGSMTSTHLEAYEVCICKSVVGEGCARGV